MAAAAADMALKEATVVVVTVSKISILAHKLRTMQTRMALTVLPLNHRLHRPPLLEPLLAHQV